MSRDRVQGRVALLVGASLAVLASSGGLAWAQDASKAADAAQKDAQSARQGPDTIPAPTQGQNTNAVTQQPGAPVADAAPQSGANNVAGVVVTGVRASVLSANAIKRNASEIVDSIVAQDIGKLPDDNVAEALQRISGIQITRNYGEGSGIAIRGLTQVQTELNGRDSFSAGGNRGLDFEDVPAELLAGIDVYKDPSAEQIEGGIGGVVNLRTRQPFDFKGFKASGSVGAAYYDLAGGVRPNVSGLISDRWDTGIGQIGLLADVSYQQTQFRQDDLTVEPFFLNSNLPGHQGQAIAVPNGVGQDETLGHRERIGASLALQWRPTENLEFNSQINRSDYYFRWDDNADFTTQGDNAGTLVAINPAVPVKATSSGDFESGSFLNVPLNLNGSLTAQHLVTTDYSVGGKWTATDRLTVSGDFQYIYATNKSQRFIIGENGPQGGAPVVNVDLSNTVPSFGVEPAGFLSNPANLPLSYGLDHFENDTGVERAVRGDAEYKVSEEGLLRSVKVGFRYTDRGAVVGSTPYAYFGVPTGVAANPNLFSVFPYSNFFRGDATSFGPTVAPNRALVDNIYTGLATLGATPVGFTPDDFANLHENTYAGYFVANYGFKLWRFPVDGNIGVRVVHTTEDTSGFNGLTPQVLQVDANGNTVPDPQGNPEYTSGATTYSPTSVKQDYTDALPSFNARIHFTDQLQLRLAASKGLTRPDFSQLNPNADIGQPSPTSILEGTQGTLTAGTFGNANLSPLRTNNYDVSLEWYFSKTGSLYGAFFYKDVKGFIATAVDNEQYFGADYEVARYYNQGAGTIKGFEVGYTQFLDFLPKPFDGFGVQANYTYVDSAAPSPTATDTNGEALTIPLQGLSKNSYNLIGIYEKGPIQARIAYNWRDSYVITTAGNGTGNLPVFNLPYGQLDGSVSYNLTKNVIFQVEARNITNARNDTDFGLETRPRDSYINDRQISAVVRVSY